MDDLIRQLTHDEQQLEEQWPDVYSALHEATIPDDAKLVLDALLDYVLAEPSNASPSMIKETLVTLVIDLLHRSSAPMSTNDLVDVFTRAIDASRDDLWSLHFAKALYDKLRIGKQLSEPSVKTELVEQILQSVQKRTLIFDAKRELNAWQSFLTGSVFSAASTDATNINQPVIIEEMKGTFQQFYLHAVRQSKNSPVWERITFVLKEFLSIMFPDGSSFDSNLSTDAISSDYLETLIRSHKDNVASITSNLESLLTVIERLIFANKYNDAHRLLSKLLIPHLSHLDLERMFRQFTRLCSLVEHREKFCAQILSAFVGGLREKFVQKTLAPLVFAFLLTILKLPTLDAPRLTYTLLKWKDFYSWKQLSDGLVDLLQTCISFQFAVNETAWSELSKLRDIVEVISDKAQAHPSLLKVLHPIAIDAVLRWSTRQDRFEPQVHLMVPPMLKLIDLTQLREDACMQLLAAVRYQLTLADAEVKNENQHTFIGISSELGNFIQHLQRLSGAMHSKLAELFLLLFNSPFYDEDHNMTYEYIVLASLLHKTVLTIFDESHARLYEPCLDLMYCHMQTEENDELCHWWTSCSLILAMKFTNIAVDHVEQYVQFMCNRKDMHLVGILTLLCSQRPDLFYAHFDQLINLLLDDQGQHLTILHGLFFLIIRANADIVLPKHVNQIFASLEAMPFNNDLCILMQSLGSIANHHPPYFDAHREKLLHLVKTTYDLRIFECLQKYLVASMLVDRETRANYQANLLTELLNDKNCSQLLKKELLRTCLLIALKNKQAFASHRALFAFPEAKLLLGYLDDAVTSELDQTAIAQARVELQQIELLVKQANVASTNTTTLLPWASPVAELLNRRSGNDWRSLGQRLGFSSTEIEHWSMQRNPCMALLHEWLATHDEDQAALGLIQALAEMNRHDAKEIIQQAVPAARRSAPIDSRRRPPVLLSFHSGQQAIASTLQDHLAAAGYPCQMIDEQRTSDLAEASMRTAKLVIFCMDRSYVQSLDQANTFKTLFLMKKPFILLQLEEVPERAIASPFQTVLKDHCSIQFFSSNNENEWPSAGFIELLSQIRYYVIPDHDLIRAPYRHWFVPRLNDLIFLQSLRDHHSFNNIPLVVLHPQIVISYQWDTHPHVLYLYERLTSLGYRVWLDLFQMASGGPLLEKYDEAINEALCLLVCVTPKYMKSHPCQHQLAQAKALGKPIVPLLVEQTSAWPSAEHPCIDVQQSQESTPWTGKPFEALLGRLQQFVPSVHVDKSQHLLDMQRPSSASLSAASSHARPKRVSSAPLTPRSRACTVM